VDLDLRLIDVNPALCRILGYADWELLGQRHDDLVHPAERGIDLAAFRGALQSTPRDTRYVVERRFARSDGATVWIRLVASLVRDDDGRPQCGVGIYEDITELRGAAEDLADQVCERSRVAEALSELQPGRDVEATAANICRAIMDLQGVDMAGLYDISTGAAVPLACR
jgi:PAS domain S-box-containing protein